MRKTVVLGIALFFVLLNLSFVFADGGYMPPPGYWVRPGAQNAIIFHENNTETLIVTSGFFGDAKDLVWLIPTPNIPKIEKANEQVFENIDALTMPQYDRGLSYGGKIFMGAAENVGSNVIVLESKNVDYYNVSVVFAISSADLIDWFNENGYDYPEEYSYVLDYYIEKHWVFTAMKINAQDLSEETVLDLREGHPTPVKLTFRSDKIVFPLKISSIEFKPKEITGKYGLALNEPIGATRTDINGNVWVKVDECITIDNGAGVTTKECSWRTNASGYEVLSYGDITIDNMPGGVRFYANPTRYGGSVPIQIYIIADGKYGADGFNIRYGNWFSKEIIEGIGIDDNGNAMIKGESEKYYITSLYSQMQKSKMDGDIFFNKTSDNNKVNAGLEPIQIFLSGLIVFLIALLIWLLFPLLGIIFIIGIIMLFVSARRGVRIAGWILCWISFGFTLLLGLMILSRLTFGASSYFSFGILAVFVILVLVLLSLMKVAKNKPKRG